MKIAQTLLKEGLMIPREGEVREVIEIAKTVLNLFPRPVILVSDPHLLILPN